VNLAPSRAPAAPETDWHASIVEWLAGLFMAPLSASAVENYRTGLGVDFLDTLAGEPRCAPGVQRIRSALTPEDPLPKVARRLAIAFTLLFDGVDGPNTVAPYESAHVGPSGRLFQAPTSEMGRLLRQWNMAVDDAFREPPDHLSIELALLAQLMRRGASHRAQAALLDDHLLAWVPIFAGRCCNADRTGFYAGAVWVLTGFLTARRASLQRSAEWGGPTRRAAGTRANELPYQQVG
jgi:TorA-specific chaperone